MSRKNQRSAALRTPRLSRTTPVVTVQPTREADFIASIVKTASNYDPDAEFIEAGVPKYTPIDLSAERDAEGNLFDLRASLYEVAVDGQSYRLNKIRGKARVLEALREGASAWNQLEADDSMPVIAPQHVLREAQFLTRKQIIDAEAKRLRESFDDGNDNGYGSDSQNWGTNGAGAYGSGYDLNAPYIPLMGGPYSKQLYQHQYLDMHRKAFEAYNHNPVAHQLVEMQTSFVLGRGVDHHCTNNDVEEVWNEFCERTNFYEVLQSIANDLWWQGEQMTEFHDDTPSKGLTDFRSIDPSTVLDIVTDPDDLQKVYYYHQQYSTPMQNYVTNGVQTTMYIIRQIPAADVKHMKINVSAGEKRGRSDLFSVLGWLKRLKDLMNARVVKGQLEAAFCFDIEINGTEAQVASSKMQLPDPFKPGSLWIHNKNAQMKAVSSQIRGNDAQPDVAALMNLIAVGFGIPKEFIGESGKGGKSGALAATEPGTKRFERRQRMLEGFCYTVANRVINNAVKNGDLDPADILQDARSVTRLAQQATTFEDRDDVKKKLLKANDSAQSDADDAQAQQQKLQVVAGKRQHELTLNQQANDHKQAMAGFKANTSHTINRNTNNGNGTSTSSTPVKEAGSLTGSAPPKPAEPDTKTDALTDSQKKRVATIKKSGNYAREFLEFIFPGIAAEDRSAKLKDLALAEAMQWLPKSVAATIAAKELDVTTYDFSAAWAQITEEAKLGLSMAKVYAQQNQNTPETTTAQDVQAEVAAEQPIAPANAQTNVPIPPAVPGEKLMPSAEGAQPSSQPPVAPGKPSNTGDGKTNKYSGPDPAHSDPTTKSHGYSAAANSPFTAEGKGKLSKESMREAIHRQLLREALGPAFDLRTKLAEIVLAANVIEDKAEVEA